MKALSLSADFAFLVDIGDKTIECRTWETNYRGDLLICANAKKIKGTIPGHALCVAKLADIRPFKKSDCKAACMFKSEMPDKAFAWILEDVRPIEPVPVKGKLGLFDVDIDPVFLPISDNTTDEEAEVIVQKYYAPLIV